MKKLLLNLLFLTNIFLIIGFWLNGSLHLLQSGEWGSIAIAIGRITGLLAEYFILILLILVSRMTWMEQIYGFDKLNKLHRYIGYWIFIFLLSHPIFLSIGYGNVLQSTVWNQFISFIISWEDVVGALLGILLLLVVIISSIVLIRKKIKYGVWHFIHLFSYVAIVMALNHQMGSGDVSSSWGLVYWFLLNYLIFGILIFYRFIRPFYLFFKHRFVIDKVVCESPDTFSVYITGKNMESFRFKSGQYINISFLTKEMYQPHPFSFSSIFNGKYIRVTIKNIGDFTGKINNLKNGVNVLIDGPLGIFTEEKSANNKYLLLAGGIGITPIRSLSESLSINSKNTILIYGAKTQSDLIFNEELKGLNIRYYPVLSIENNTSFEFGRIDEERIKRIAPDFKERDIYLCGPSSMMSSIIKILKSLGVNDGQIHFEEFSF